MFARTERLLLRPGWPEDAPALHAAIADEGIVRNLGRAPWPYTLSDAKAFLALAPEGALPRLLIVRPEPGGARVIGGTGLHREAGAIELGYWLARAAWGQGYATEAAAAVLAMARALGLAWVRAGHFVDNPASARVLARLGFRPLGIVVERESRGRGCRVPTNLSTCDLAVRGRSLAA